MGRKKIIRVALFPYDDEMYPYLRCSAMLDGIKIQFLLSPKNWGVENVNVCGYCIQSELLDEDFEKIDAVWICDSIGEISDENLFEVCRIMLSKGKQIIMTRHTGKDTYEKIEELAKNYSSELVSVDCYTDNLSLNDNLGFLEHIMTPVISVSGPGENTDKFLTQLLLKEYLEKNGCKTVLISSRVSSCLLKGVYSFPKFMGYEDMSAERKIICYNRMVKKIERETNPDVIIVGIPGSILPSPKINARNFELGPYSVFKAVKPLYSIMCLYGNYVSYDYLNELRQTMKYKYGTDVDFYYRSSSAVDINMFLGNDLNTIEPIYANMDESAYIYDDISRIGEEIIQKIKKM